MNIKDFCTECHRTAREHGFWPEDGRNFAEAMMLIVTELSEAVEADRHENWEGKDGVIEELIDVWVRLGDATLGFLLEWFGGDDSEDSASYVMDYFLHEMRKKVKYNQARPYKHGKEY